MALYIKDSALACPATKVLQATDFYKPFPSCQDVAFNDNQLLPIGLLAYSKLDANSDDNILIALPISMEIFDGDLPYISYSLTDNGWQVDAHNVDNLSEEKEDFEDYSEYYQQAASFYAKHQRLNYSLDENDESVPLFEFGVNPYSVAIGTPICGMKKVMMKRAILTLWMSKVARTTATTPLVKLAFLTKSMT